MALRLPISTERLVIRPFREADRTRFVAFLTDESATRWLNFTDAQRTPGGASSLFDTVVVSYGGTDPIAAYTVADRRNDGFVGSCGYSMIGADIFECFWIISPDHQGRGFGTEAARTLSEALMNDPDVTEMRAYIHPDNAFSLRIARRIGMTDCGLATHPTTGQPGRLFISRPPARTAAQPARTAKSEAREDI